MNLIAIAIATVISCGNHAPKEDARIDLTECHNFPGQSNWFTCPEGKVTQIVHKEPDGTTQVVIVADEGRIFWVNPRAKATATQLGKRYKWSLADDQQDDGIVINSIGGRVVEMRSW